MDSRIPELIQPLLNHYLTLIEQSLPGFMLGFYLHGSIALGAFNEHFSDIDFIATISRVVTADDFERLSQIHHVIASNYPHWSLEGSYLQPHDLGQFQKSIPAYPTYYEGVLNPMAHHDVNSVTWWILKNRGVAVFGTEPRDLAFAVDFNLLLDNMKQNLNSYWAAYTRKPTRITWLFTDYGIQWTVLGVLRQWYTFQEHDITSKTGAGAYALTCMPQAWHRLIREAIAIREQNHMTQYKSRIGRAMDAFAFLRYVIQVCNNVA